jgi:hypothetical protein
VALIGSIEQFTLSGVLGRLETHAKTGLLVIQQGRTWVELYFREGQLMCIGPVRTSANLGERLLQDGVISQQALQETLLAVGADQLDEVSIAITLVNLGHTTKEKLRAWSMQKTLAVLQALLVWTNGDIYFEDDTPTPSGRLLAAFSIASLLAMMPQLETPSTTLPSTRAASYQPEQTAQSVSPVTPTPSMPDITRFRTLMGASYSPSQGDSPVQTPLPESPATNEVQEAPLLSAASLMEPDAFTPRSSQTRDLDSQPLSFQASEAVVESLSAQSLFDDDVLPSSFGTQVSFTGAFTDAADADDEGAFSSLFGGSSDGNAAESNQQANAISFVPPQPISIPVPSRFVDTSYMRPDMILMPLDLSALHTQNTLMALTPEQWRVLTVVDGRTSLQDACRDLSMTPDLLCQVAAELVADQLIQLVPPGAAQAREISPISADVMAPGPGNGYVAPGYAASPAQPWAASVPLTPSEVASQFPSAISFEARSQWGNGGNGASFVPGRGWVASPQPLQPLSPSNPSLVNAGSYVQIGGGRQ